MNKKQRGLLIPFSLIFLTMILSACTQSLSSAPAKTPTVNPNAGGGVFVSPIPSVENPMAMIEEFAKQTAAAQTVAAGGAPAGTPDPFASPNPLNVTPTPDIMLNITPTNIGTAAVISTPFPAGARPASYTLQEGEFPYCIARRFNVDPDQLLSLSGLTSPDVYYQGLVLKIPQSGSFPGQRSLKAHPSSYTVASSDETIYSIACKFGDVDPAAIASANGISAGAKLTLGQQISIP